MRIEFGSYAQVFEDNLPSNTLRARSLGAIALTPADNAQGDYFSSPMATGNRISRHAWTELPLPDTAIARVEALALHQKNLYTHEYGRRQTDDDHRAHNDNDQGARFEDDNDDDHIYNNGDNAHVYEDDQGAHVNDYKNQDAHDDDNNKNIQEANFDHDPEATEAQVVNNEDLEQEVIDKAAHRNEHEAAEGQQTPHRPYNIQGCRRGSTNTFSKDAMDDPHSNHSYFPPTAQIRTVGRFECIQVGRPVHTN